MTYITRYMDAARLIHSEQRLYKYDVAMP